MVMALVLASCPETMSVPPLATVPETVPPIETGRLAVISVITSPALPLATLVLRKISSPKPPRKIELSDELKMSLPAPP